MYLDSMFISFIQQRAHYYILYFLIKMKCSFVTSVGQRLNSESLTGIKPMAMMASQIPIGALNWPSSARVSPSSVVRSGTPWV